MSSLRKGRRQQPRAIDDQMLAAAVERVMMNPAYNSSWMPDLVESYVHRQVAEAVLNAIAALPPIELYGHVLKITVAPK